MALRGCKLAWAADGDLTRRVGRLNSSLQVIEPAVFLLMMQQWNDSSPETNSTSWTLELKSRAMLSVSSWICSHNLHVHTNKPPLFSQKSSYSEKYNIKNNILQSHMYIFQFWDILIPCSESMVHPRTTLYTVVSEASMMCPYLSFYSKLFADFHLPLHSYAA